MNIYLGKDYSAMKGPCPTGYHIPSNEEWGGIKTIMDLLGLTTGDSWRINLHMPFAGGRSCYSSNITDQGSLGYYWSSSPYGSSIPYYAHELAIYSSTVYANTGSSRANGHSIRCFNDSYMTPDSTWTVIQGTLGGAGIFWNQTDGLISITDGVTGYTIQDKNLGATVVYNDGDTLSEANCGKYYQWGNNYGFPRTGSVTKSSTKVDASAYGPGNYYSSSTFITVSVGGNEDWSSVYNDNLRGGVTGVKPGEVKNIYIGEYIPDFATQGPCPEGFHVPQFSEWQSLMSIWSGLGLSESDSTGRGNYLKLPISKYIEIDGTYATGGSYYWSCSLSPYTARYIGTLGVFDNVFRAQYSTTRAKGCPIRPFYNNAVIPNSSWTVLYQGTGDAGIYYNSTLGLISLSSDGTNWITISDKNLGATTIYNNGDTLSESNCGKLYQWGNNYGFPYNGTITKSSTKVNASNYGPGNYYSSSTFITTTSSPYDRSSVQNDNLRGGVDGNVPVV